MGNPAKPYPLPEVRDTDGLHGIPTVLADGRRLAGVQLEATVTRADGTVEEHGVIAEHIVGQSPAPLYDSKGNQLTAFIAQPVLRRRTVAERHPVPNALDLVNSHDRLKAERRERFERERRQREGS